MIGKKLAQEENKRRKREKAIKNDKYDKIKQNIRCIKAFELREVSLDINIISHATNLSIENIQKLTPNDFNRQDTKCSSDGYTDYGFCITEHLFIRKMEYLNILGKLLRANVDVNLLSKVFNYSIEELNLIRKENKTARKKRIHREIIDILIEKSKLSWAAKLLSQNGSDSKLVSIALKIPLRDIQLLSYDDIFPSHFLNNYLSKPEYCYIRDELCKYDWYNYELQIKNLFKANIDINTITKMYDDLIGLEYYGVLEEDNPHSAINIIKSIKADLDKEMIKNSISK